MSNHLSSATILDINKLSVNLCDTLCTSPDSGTSCGIITTQLVPLSGEARREDTEVHKDHT